MAQDPVWLARSSVQKPLVPVIQPRVRDSRGVLHLPAWASARFTGDPIELEVERHAIHGGGGPQSLRIESGA